MYYVACSLDGYIATEGSCELAASFRDDGLISRYIIALILVVLGSGIPLFAEGGQLEQLELVETSPAADALDPFRSP